MQSHPTMKSWLAAPSLLVVAACNGAVAEPPTPEAKPVTTEQPSTPEPPDAPPQSQGPGRVCCTAACGAIFEASFRPAIDDATLQGSTISVCRNAECFETTLADIALPTTGPGSGQGKWLVDAAEREQTHAPLINVTIWDRESPGAPRRLSLDYTPWASNDWHDGDVYDVTLKDGQGSVVVHQESAVTYAISQVCCSTCGRAVVDDGS